MFTAGNNVWFPHRGCKNLVLPYNIYADSIKSDSKSFNPALAETNTSVGAQGLDTALIETGTSVDALQVDTSWSETGTSVDAPRENTTLSETGTSVDTPQDTALTETGTRVGAPQVDTALFENGTTVDAHPVGTALIETETSVDAPEEDSALTETGTSVDAIRVYKVANLTNNNVDALLKEEVNNKEILSGITSPSNISVGALTCVKANDKEMLHDIANLESNDADTLTDEEASGQAMLSDIADLSNNDADTLTDGEARCEETQNDGPSNDSSEETAHIYINVSSSFTYLAFWNRNNCNSVNTSDTRHLLGNMAESYMTGIPEIQRRFKSVRYFPVTHMEYLFYENPGEYNFVRDTRGYAHIRKKSFWNPEWWCKLVCWSCRICALGILVIFGYCLNEKYKDMCLYW
ncbi:uncharacterized protein LOC123523403 [Mercenaria mercenaria]|uniref:uncharacterized protein LOC123523403 n=1 Tax=Mercenaria mercenaria TaxID=6596 RepID=UPI00234F752F|nr:uncharacterized protein LOC123523403 [Mercenaria mercenaria]